MFSLLWKKIIIYNALLYLVLQVQGGAVAGMFTFASARDEARYHQLTNELRCPKCQNQSIADSDALVAQDLRRAVYEQVQSGKNDQQIIDFMVKRYGNFILYRPPVNKVTGFLWFGPLVILILGLLLVWRIVCHYKKNTADGNNNGVV